MVADRGRTSHLQSASMEGGDVEEGKKQWGAEGIKLSSSGGKCEGA